jgi:hypothetical protein
VGGYTGSQQYSPARFNPPAPKAGYVVIALGSNVHIFARPHRRAELARCFETVPGSPVRTVELPGIDQPMLIVSFPGGGISASSSPTVHPMTSSRAWAPGSSCAPMTRLLCTRPPSGQD